MIGWGALLACMGAGAMWSVVGWAYQRNAAAGRHPALIIFALSACAAVLVGPYAVITGATDGAPGGVAVWMSAPVRWYALSGLISVAWGMAIQVAMRRVQPSITWAISQCAPIVPLLVSVLFHGERLTLPAAAGVACMALAIVVMKGRRQHPPVAAASGAPPEIRTGSSWWPIAAFLLIGCHQAAMAEPAHADAGVPTPVRLMIFFVSMALLSGAIIAIARVRLDRAVLSAGAIAAGAGLLGQCLILISLDWLAATDAAGLAYPCAIGTTILTFALGRRLRGERLSKPALVGIGLIVVGLIGLGFS